jgi:hypothetical protein
MPFLQKDMNFFVIFAAIVDPEGFIPEPDPESLGRLGSLKLGQVNSSGSTAELLH